MSLKSIGNVSAILKEIAVSGSISKATFDSLNLSLQGLNEAQIAATVSLSGLSAEQVASSLKASGFTATQTAATMATLQFSEQATMAAMSAAGFEKAQIKDAVAATTFTAAETAATAATGGLSAAMSGLTAVMAANPFMIAVTAISLLIAIVPMAINLFNKFHKTTEELKQEYDDLASELDGLNSELKTTKDRIAELQKLSDEGRITLVEQEELDRLLETNAQLERQIRLKNEAAQEAADKSNKSLVKDYNNEYYNSNAGMYMLFDADAIRANNAEGFKALEEWHNGWSENWDKFSEEEQERLINLYSEYQNLMLEGNNKLQYPEQLGFDDYVDQLIARYKELEGLGQNATDSQIAEMASIRSELLSLSQTLQNDYIDNFVGDGDDVKNWNNLADAIDACINPAEHFTSLLEKLPNDLKDVLNSEGSEGGLTAERINELAGQYQELAKWMEDSGYTAYELASHYNALKVETDSNAESTGRYSAQLSDLTETLSDLQSAYDVLATAQEEMAGGGGLSPDTIADLAEAEANYLDYLYEENGVIKLNTEAWKENANTKMLGDIDEIQKEISSLEERNEVLAQSLEMYRTNKSMSIGDTSSIAAWDKKIKDTTDEINANTEAIAANQAKLTLYSSLYGSITGDTNAYASALNNFINIANTIDSVSDSFQTLADLQAQVANGFTMSLDKALEFAKVYPEILNNAQVSSNGQIALNKEVVNSFLTSKKKELDTQIDTQIAELQADKTVLEAKMQAAQAQLELAKNVGEGEGQVAKEVAEYRIKASNEMVQALIDNGIDEAEAYKLAAQSMALNAEEFDRVARDVCTDVDGNFNAAAYNAAMGIYENMERAKTDIASVAKQAHESAKAIEGMANGVVKGSVTKFAGSFGGKLRDKIKTNITSGEFNGFDFDFDFKGASLEDFVSQVELDISSYQKAISQIDGQIAALQALKNAPLKNFKSGSGSSTKEIEEYIAAIDDYREAIERLNRVQIKKSDLETQLLNTNDLRTQIELQQELIGVYKEEQDALHDLNELRDQTIKDGTESLRQLGFDVEYDPDKNNFFVKNLEHLNELVADSKGEYNSLQEATNALRQDTENLINTLGDLNEANQENSESWLELAQAMKEARISIYENTRKESENQIKLSENWLNNAINRPVQVSIPVSVDKSELQELIDSYKEEISTAQELGIDINKTIYGNIDTNNRQILEWTEENLNKYKDALASWDTTVDEMRGSFSTIFGSSSEYDGIEIAFSPILQTENGPVLLDSHTVDEYIYGLIDKAGEGWTNEKLLQLDTEGLEFDGQIIKNLLADIGDTAIQTGEAMHYVGDLGSISTAYKDIEDAAAAAKMSVDDLNRAIANGSVDNIGTTNVSYYYDVASIETHIAEIVGQYRKMQETIHEEAEYYRSLGYADTSDEVSELSDLWWDYYDKIAETAANAWQQVVDNANDALDRITGIYDTLKDAAQEYADSGFITIDTLQEICSWGVQYLAYLKDENGQLVINEDSIQKVIAARTEQMAVETALSYVQQIRSAIERNEISELMNLTMATEFTTNATWDLVYAQLKLLNVSGDLNDTMYAGALQNINNLRALSGIAITSIGKVEGSVKEANESAKKALQEQSDYLDDLLKYVMAMIKQEVKNQVEAIEDQIDSMKDLIDLQKKSLDLEKEKDEYARGIADKEKAIADLRKQLAALDLDDSREAAAKKAKLQEELSDKINDLSDYQSDHAYDAAADMLDQMGDAYEREKKKEIEILENTISSEEKLYQLAIDRISNHWDTLYQDLTNWVWEYGNITQNTLDEAWNTACDAIQRYGSYLEAVLQTQQQLAALEITSSNNSYTSGATGDGDKPNKILGNTGDYDTSGSGTLSEVKKIVAQMKANSAQHRSEDAAGKLRLNKANLALGEQLASKIGRVVVRGNDGVWYLDKVGGLRLYDTYPYSTYHTGGIAGDNPTLKQKEIMAKLEKGEAIIPEKQQEGLYEILDANDTMLSKYGKLFSSVSTVDLFGEKMDEQLKKDSSQTKSMVENRNFNISVTAPVEVYPLQKLDAAEIQRLTKDISKHTVSKINEVFTKNGMDSVLNPLRPH